MFTPSQQFSFRLQYADPVADLLDQWGVFRARLFRESCVFHRGNYVKDLSRLGRELGKVIIIDNSPASYIFHPENAVSSHSHQGPGPVVDPGTDREAVSPLPPSEMPLLRHSHIDCLCLVFFFCLPLLIYLSFLI